MSPAFDNYLSKTGKPYAPATKKNCPLHRIGKNKPNLCKRQLQEIHDGPIKKIMSYEEL